MTKNHYQMEALTILCTVRDMARERIILTREERDALQVRLERLIESLCEDTLMTISGVAEDACDAFIEADYNTCEKALIELVGLLK